MLERPSRGHPGTFSYFMKDNYNSTLTWLRGLKVKKTDNGKFRYWSPHEHESASLPLGHAQKHPL